MTRPSPNDLHAWDTMAAALPATPCPPWCARPAGHAWQMADPFTVSRGHSRRFGRCEVIAEESLDLETGDTDMPEPTLYLGQCTADDLSPDDAERLGRDLLAAAAFLRSLANRRRPRRRP